ncbi:hypothetical protein EVJ50_10555 [Synechococcus sp. RSCCF101]|uniref:hypothetical protein n=1 Tax=Synechococcus sp. RSCCF101 TaxID=2511069 RepID=UPI0012464699|nr:hypothetical protein [Synechococcus sp. RSCCF101]QEY32595.1 hypothetical protein EVJ50_10555 [Synechococcus sp. RSCCF101]
MDESTASLHRQRLHRLELGEPPSPPEPPPRSLQRIAELEGECLRLRRELEASQSRLLEMESLLSDLPGIFERKFQQRLQPLLQQQRLIAAQQQQERPLLTPAAAVSLEQPVLRPRTRERSAERTPQLQRLRERLWGWNRRHEFDDEDDSFEVA